MTNEKTYQAADGEQTQSGAWYKPSVDIYETADELVLVAYVPGVQRGDIDIQFDGDELTLRAPAKQRQAESTSYLLHEYGVGDFQRTFRVSDQVDASRIAADYAQGVLTVHLPKAEAVKPRKIEVRSAS
jgi:HSP20 family molecular chaperone IbpA